MTLPFKPHFIALACSLALCAAAGTLYVKSRQPVSVTPSVAEAAPVSAPAVTATFSPAQIDQWVAPIALYPDALLSQVLMASTYPASVVQAVQWSKDNPTMQGDAAISAVANQPWDASVKSLVAFPQLMSLMGGDPQWVENLGNAFLAQPQDVMDSVQKLRALAQQTGTLKSTPQQTVKVVTAPAPASAPKSASSSTKTTPSSTHVVSAAPTVITIEPASPEVVYVPNYNPTVVYGSWPNTAYPPVYLQPSPGQQFTESFVKGFGYSLGVATTYALFSSIDWDDDDHDHHHHDDDHDHDYHDGHNGYVRNGDNININVNNYNRITGDHLTDNRRVWEHNPAYRNGVPYANDRIAQRFHQPGAIGGLSTTPVGNRDSQRQAARATLQEKTGKSLSLPASAASRQAMPRQLEQIAQRNNYRGYDTSDTQRDAARAQLQQRLSSTTPDQRQAKRDDAKERLNSVTPEQRQARRENVQQRVSASTPEQRQARRENVQQRVSSSTPEQRQARRESIQQRHEQREIPRARPAATALSGNDSRSPSSRAQQLRGSESRKRENLSTEQRAAIRERHH